MDDVRNYEVFKSFSDLSQEDQALIEEARQATEVSYSPYSGFSVGCAIRMVDKKVIKGANQENASSPAGRCAEAVTFNMYGVMYVDVEIESVAVAALQITDNLFVPVSPCGICRQVMLEYERKQNKAISLLMQIRDLSWIKTSTCEMLLPFSFTKDNL